MSEKIFLGQKGEDSGPRETHPEGLGGISAQLEKVYNSLVMGDALKRPEYADAAELVSDFIDIVRNGDGSPLDVPEAVRALRIIAKEQGWTGDTWSWDVIRREAAGMNYQVRPPRTRDDLVQAA